MPVTNLPAEQLMQLEDQLLQIKGWHVGLAMSVAYALMHNAMIGLCIEFGSCTKAPCGARQHSMGVAVACPAPSHNKG